MEVSDTSKQKVFIEGLVVGDLYVGIRVKNAEIEISL
jgi:hypothetical protein